MSDLFENHIVGFPTRRLILIQQFFSHVETEPLLHFGHPGPEVIKLFSSSAQLSMKFQLLINVEMVKISGKFRFIAQYLVIYPANKW